MKNRFLLFLFYSICSVFILNAQDFSFYHYGLEDGISQQTIRCILKDSNGFLWLGTQDGLNRFDGTSFTVYKNKQQDSLTIKGNFINALVEDSEGNVWVGTSNNGVSIYDASVNSFKTTSIRKGNCTSLAKTSNGTIIATTLNKGVFIFDNQSNSGASKVVSVANDERLQFTSSFVYKDNFFVASQDGRLFVSENILSNDVVFKEIVIGKYIGTINTLFVTNDDIWLGTSNGLFVFDRTKKLLSNVKLENKAFNEKLVVSSIDIYDNTFYIGTFDGLFIAKKFNKINRSFEEIRTYKGEQEHTNSITSNRVYDTFTDGNLLWIGTNNLDVVTLNPPVFKKVNTTTKIALNNAFILAFTKNDDYVFVGTRKGINCISKTGKVYYITEESTNGTLAFNVIRAMAIDRNNYLWVGTLKGVSVINLTNFNPNNPEVISIYNDVNDVNSLSSNAIRGVYIDHLGSVWINTLGGGVNRFTGNIKTNNITFKRYRANDKENSICSDFTYNMSQDKNLDYWITSEHGLSKLHFKNADYKNPNFTNYFHDINDTTSISSSTTLHTWHDADKTLWVATQDGFNKFNATNKTFKRYMRAQGLTNTFVYSITEDVNNDLWLTTNGGIFRFNKATEQFTNYNQGDGLQSSEFNLGAHYYNKEINEIYAGGVNGFNVFNPSNVSSLDNEGNLIFTSLKIKDKEVNPISHARVLNKSINKVKEVYLNYDDFPSYIEFSDLDLRPTKNNQFMYSLNNGEWNNLTNSREIQILDLPKGKHTLKIQGKSRNKVWTKQPLELIIHVKPPWYNSNLAYILYVLSALALMYLFYRLSLQRQLAAQEAKRLKDLDNLKSQFITNITHEFRTPLTLILGYVTTLKELVTNKKEVKHPIESIEGNSANLLNLVNEMLDLAKLEKGKLKLNNTQQDIVALTKYIVHSFTSMAQEKNVNVQFSSSVSTLQMDVDVEKIRQIISNLVSNAIKFSKENDVIKINLAKENKQLIVTVKDTGVGIAKEEIKYVFDRFYQGKKSTEFKSGSGIGLALTKELVSLMKGSITVTSKEGVDTTFTLKLPITSQAVAKESEQIESIITDKIHPIQATNIATKHIHKELPSILIVEDNLEVANYIASCLQGAYNIYFAENGEKGFNIAQAEIPDIIITDVKMPVMDGYILTQKLQETKITNHIPIIMLTAKVQQEDKIAGIKSGADVYLTKPFQKEELLLRIEAILEKRKKLQEHYRVVNVITTDRDKVIKDKNLAFLNQVIQCIHTQIENSDYNAKTLAKEMHMSESQLYKKLKAVTNKSTAIFIRTVRLEKAKELLLTTDLSVSEIAYATGFKDPNWFGKAFKETFKKSPTEIRKE